MKIRLFLPLFILLALFASASVSAQTSTGDIAAESQSSRTIKLKVGGINCSADCKDIQNEVKKVNGVTACTMKGKPGAVTSFEVTFDPSIVSETDIRKVVEATPGCSNPDSRPYKVKG